MSRRFRQSVSLCLLVTWSVSSLLAMVWHPHDHVHEHCCHGADCGESTRLVHRHVHSHACDHSHSHHGHHHHHDHSHAPSEKESPDETAPHTPENCPSCQLLAISVIIPHRVEISLLDELIVALPATDTSAIECDPLTTLRLRGPPVTSMI